ncbi:zinc finger protein 345-like [Pollicipes pollicipes]|uniref:zinc finger protein 345-like n=1 Tax=Pollicipes pollicipes TaxID=41117 RepID=UPI001884E33B|nr:zinc finger protein 345-like [Pollicipes pollicipes]XP_037091579.1 zinc finger protein 345-like [Pollicipes pollicipes]XP_037091580.1 zinc finger protein 345-like [Pollicipes pollicipes]XP_037091581.1 zinc finger protein 345-like [Pollicipes pollicipes]XP_037091582.1 zinc finger protein 345-like [Pollicipes pollicipes]
MSSTSNTVDLWTNGATDPYPVLNIGQAIPLSTVSSDANGLPSSIPTKSQEAPGALSHLSQQDCIVLSPPKCAVCGRSIPHYPTPVPHLAPFSQATVEELSGLSLGLKTTCQSCVGLFQRLDYHQTIVNTIKNGLKKCVELQPRTDFQGPVESALPCTMCPVTVADRAALSSHLAFHLQGSQLPCTRCGRQFTSWLTLRRHALAVHQGALLSRCRRCPAAFNTSAKLVAHKLIHHGAAESLRRHCCPTCGRRFASPHRYVTHLRTHGADTEPEVRRTLAALAAGRWHAASSEGGQRDSGLDAPELARDEYESMDAASADDPDDSDGGGAIRDEAETEKAAIAVDSRTSSGVPDYQSPAEAGKTTVQPSTGSFHCGHCDKVFKRKQSLDRHIDAIHKPSANWKCTQCEKMFSIKFYWQKHMNRHRDKSEQCSNCQRRFVNARALSQHKCLSSDYSQLAAVAPGATAVAAECPFCQRQPLTGAELGRHVGSHDPQRPFTCTCGGAYTSRQGRDAHAAVHSGQRQFVCGECGGAFVTQARLAAHRRTHQLATAVHACRSCPAVLGSVAALRKHSMQHRERSFQCSVCGKCFRWKNNLDIHARIHADERPYQCDVCGHATRCSANLRLHKQRVHSSARPHVCGTCQKGFKERYNLAIHLRSHTGERPYVCERCGAGFVTKGKLNSHMSKHSDQRPHECPLCLKPLKTAAIVAKHCRRVHSLTAGEAAARAREQRHPPASSARLKHELAPNHYLSAFVPPKY